MQTIIDYRIIAVFSLDAAKLEAYVNTAIKVGWAPQGGVSVSAWNGQITMFQAMVKYEQSNPLSKLIG